MQPRIWHQHYDPHVPFDIEVPEIPLHQFLVEGARQYPDLPCIRYNQLTFTYAQTDQLSDRIARNLIALGLCKGDCVGICMGNIPQFVVLYFAVLKAGGVVAAINPRFGSGEMHTLLADVRPFAMFASQEPAQLIEHLNGKQLYQHLIITNEDQAHEMLAAAQRASPLPAQPQDFLDFLRTEPEPTHQLPPVFSQDDCIYQYSGGTTGTPKAAAAMHRSLVANVLQFRSWLTTLEPQKETTLIAIPLYHVYGMVIGMCVTLSQGNTMLLHDERNGLAGMLALIHEQKPTLFPAVPFLLEVFLLQETVKQGKVDFSSLKIVISGASPLRVACLEEFSRLLTGGVLVEGYGLSEAPTATHCNPVQGEIRPGTIGLPLPGVDVRIIDVNDGRTEMPLGEQGEMLIRSPQLMRGYLNREEETNLVLNGGWLATGDIARMDADGYFAIVDRKKDLIKVSGYQVWPNEIETVLGLHPDIYETGVVSVPENVLGEKVVAWLVMEKGKTITLADVQAWCNQRLAAYKQPLAIHFCEKLPRSALGKLLRRELREWSINSPSG